jgi:hypothetical protein
LMSCDDAGLRWKVTQDYEITRLRATSYELRATSYELSAS